MIPTYTLAGLINDHLKFNNLMVHLTKESRMPFGRHKDEKLGSIPAWYLLKIRDNFWLQENLKKYIDDNRKALEERKKRESRFESK
jgi:hypothetical protein